LKKKTRNFQEKKPRKKNKKRREKNREKPRNFQKNGEYTNFIITNRENSNLWQKKTRK
jgi:hypothetical protein